MTLMHLTIDTRNADNIKLYENVTNLTQIQTEKETARVTEDTRMRVN